MENIAIAIPENLENMQLPDPELLNYWRMAEKRIFWIEDEINASVSEIVKHIIEINDNDREIPADDRKPIIIMLNSPGGYITDTFQLISVIQASITPVYTVNAGMAFSGAFLVLISGHKRFAFKYATALCHSGSGGTSGTFEQTEAQQKNYKQQVEMMGSYILKQTKIDPKLYARKKKSEWYIQNDECISLGIIDAEISSIDELLN